MSTSQHIQRLVSEALEILTSLGVPLEGLTPRRREKMAKAFAAIADINLPGAWAEVKDNDQQHRLLTRQIIKFMNHHLGENIADSSDDDIRRKDLVLPVQACIVMMSAQNPNANTNDRTCGYALHPSAAKAIRCYGTTNWDAQIQTFLSGRQTLAQDMQRVRNLARIPVTLNRTQHLTFSAGEHNVLQKNIIEKFLPIYGFGAEVLYVGDTTKKYLHRDEKRLQALNFFEIAHDKLPDVVAHSESKNWIYLIEAVTTANPIDELRRRALAKLTQNCTAQVIYVSAFQDRATYRKFAKDIAWETEVWIADAPEHMIHFNGDKFLGPYARTR